MTSSLCVTCASPAQQQRMAGGYFQDNIFILQASFIPALRTSHHAEPTSPNNQLILLFSCLAQPFKIDYQVSTKMMVLEASCLQCRYAPVLTFLFCLCSYVSPSRYCSPLFFSSKTSSHSIFHLIVLVIVGCVSSSTSRCSQPGVSLQYRGLSWIISQSYTFRYQNSERGRERTEPLNSHSHHNLFGSITLTNLII